MSATIRPYRDGDKAAVYDVCVRTAGAGRGVRGRYSTDDLVPDIVACLYMFLEPRHAYVPEPVPAAVRSAGHGGHIYLLLGYRRSGHGREMMSTFLASVAAAGAPSCYLSVRPENVDALRFYARLGWRQIEVSDPGPGVYLALCLAITVVRDSSCRASRRRAR